MKKRITSVILTLLLCVSLAVPALAGTDINAASTGNPLKNPTTATITIPLPNSNEITLKLENVYDEYVYLTYEASLFREYYFFFAETGAITSDKHVVGTQMRYELDGNPWGANRADLTPGERVQVGVADPAFGYSTSYLQSYTFDVYSDGTIFIFNEDLADGVTRAVTIHFSRLETAEIPDINGSGIRSLSPISELVKAETPPALTAKPTASKVLVNGESKSFDAYNIADNNYFKLRDLAFVLNGTDKQFAVGYDEATKAIALTSGAAYTPVGGEMTDKGTGSKTPVPTTSKITLDGKEVSFTAYGIDGNNYFKLRDIGEAFGFGVDWDGVNSTIVIDTGKAYTPE